MNNSCSSIQSVQFAGIRGFNVLHILSILFEFFVRNNNDDKYGMNNILHVVNGCHSRRVVLCFMCSRI